jgi:hypothetical protein
MADKGHHGFAGTDEERLREASAGGHASHEKGTSHEFNNQGESDEGRRGSHARTMAHASHQPAGAEGSQSGANRSEGGQAGGEEPRSKRTRGGTHAQHVTAGKKGGSRIRQLIELGYKYEQEHGIGPGQNERSKLAAKRRATKTQGEDEGQAGADESGS